jgi:hypothetical protein
MTPHALRRPNGYCLNEITRATANRLSIFPVLVCESVPPPMISMLPFFDMRDCVPATPPLPENSNNHDWLKLMQSHLDSELFQEKANKLYHVLELCDSMNAYGVPAIAGLENLGVFCNDQHDGHPGFIKDLKSTSFRRSLMINTGTSGRSHSSSVSRRINESTATSEMTDPILSSSSLPHISPKSTTDLTRKESLQEIGTPTTDCPPLISPTSTTVTSPIISDDKQQQNAAFKARYFFSFDPTCLVLARRLYQDLSTIGFLVYKPQADQEDRQEAIRWTASEKNGKMILLVTPESVGRPHGVCLNDISAAMSAGLGFVPLMIRQCEIPLSICRIQWLDMTDTLFYTSNHQQEHFSSTRDSCSHPNEGDGISSFPQHKLASINEARYKLRQEQLVTALKGQLDHEGQQDCLFSLLAPFSFQSEMFSRLTERFTGREWMFKRLEEWLNGPPSQSHRVFWITGQIGAGKTSIAARIVQQFAEVAAVHFAFQEDEQTQHARRCVLSLAYQLTTQLPDYAVFLHSSGRSNEPLEEIVAVSSLSALVNHLLIQPLNAIAPPKSNKPVVLLIDGIERLLFRSKEDVPPSNPPGLEGNQNGSTTNPTECFISMLPNLIANLPYWVRVVILSREDQQTVMKLQNYTPTICLDRFVEENKQDIKKYISKSLSFSTSTSTSSSISMSRSDIHTETTAMLSLERIQTLVSERAEGLFLYAVNIVQQIENGRLQIKDIASLPLGMGGYLRQLFENQCDLTYYKQKIRPILEVLCAAYEPLTLSTLGSILEWTSYEQNEILGSSGTLFYLTEVDQIVKTFHSSVLDWVQDIKNAGPFFVEVA